MPVNRGEYSIPKKHDNVNLSINALAVLKRRYLLKDERGQVIETPAELFWRVARHVAAPDAAYGDDPVDAAREFNQVLTAGEFLPNSPTLMNAGTQLGLLSACFVLPVPDSIPGIFDAVKYMAIIHQAGGGTGFSFSRLRPQGDIVGSTHGVASGPVSFMGAFDSATAVVKQGGRRRGANMGVLRVDHPDIMEFINIKKREGNLGNFNLSVAATDAFMAAVQDDTKYDLINPRTGKVTGRLRAQVVLKAIAAAAWRYGDPGLIFIDRINAANPTPQLGPMETTNPCGEQPLLPYESCNLGSIDLAKLVRGAAGSASTGHNGDGGVDIGDGGGGGNGGKGNKGVAAWFDWQRLGELVDIAVHFLDNVIDANRLPLPEITSATIGNRKIGLGVMGFAEALVRMGIPYDSEAGLAMGEKIMSFIETRAVARSEEIAGRRGSFPNFTGSLWQQRGYARMRNATVTTIAPTGTISVIAGTSSGIEPLFAVSFVRDVMDGTQLLESNLEFERLAREQGFYTEDLMMKVARTGSVRDISGIPEPIKALFRTAMEIGPKWHVRMQAVFQRHVDNAVSKTINLPHDAGMDDVHRAYLLAYELGCKGITVFRYGSRKQQVLYLGQDLDNQDLAGAPDNFQIRVASEYSGGCPTVDCEF